MGLPGPFTGLSGPVRNGERLRSARRQCRDLPGLAAWASRARERTQRPLAPDGRNLVLGATPLGIALASRARHGSMADPFLLVAVTTALALQIAGVYLSPLRALLGTEPLSAGDLAVACGLSALGYLAMRLRTRLFPAR